MNIIRIATTTTWMLPIVITLSSCHHHHDEDQHEHFSVSGDTIVVHIGEKNASLLRLDTVRQTAHQLEFNAPGTVKAIPNFYAEIAPPFAGRVTAVHLRLGMMTKPGTPLFEMSSQPFSEAQKIFFQAKSAYVNAGHVVRRQQDLYGNGVGSQRDLEEAQASYEIAEKEYQNAKASLQLFHVNVDKLIFGQPLVITSPIEGEVVTNEVVLGQFLKEDETPRAKVAELSKVWVVAMVKEKDLRHIERLRDARISIDAFPEKPTQGKIYHIDKVLNEDTRSVQVMIECTNTDRLLRPGMFATVIFSELTSNTIFIPQKALLQSDDKSYVLLQTKKDHYVKRFVTTGVTVQDSVQILSGLSVHDILIGQGAFYLLNAQ